MGIPLSMDSATDHRTRPSMVKVRVEVDLTKPKINTISVGSEDEGSPLKGFNQKLQYENGQNQKHKENTNEQNTDDSTIQPQIHKNDGIKRSIDEDKSSIQEINFGLQSGIKRHEGIQLYVELNRGRVEIQDDEQYAQLCQEDMGLNNRNMDELNNLVERDDE
ncbi:hypothetical protein HAX54_026693 [Datura stramonium]|uniref:Uncharacterized protein n=1 Tax=Datura stramonium TaxID=4076 RepID=A0ABS8V3L3_DATST|nr:hypothetical protein [Datura stramonium]